MMDEILNQISVILGENPYLAPILAFFAGVMTSLTPCSLSSIPLVVGYVGGTGQQDTGRALKLSLTFALGTAVTFTALGVVASLAGSLLGTSANWWYLLLGVLMVLMALQTWGIYQIVPSTYLLSKNKKKGYLGALISGILGGIFSSPCSTPVLIALLAIVAGEGNLVFGTLLLLVYSMGHGLLAVVAGTSVGFVQTLSQSEKYGKLSKILNLLMGFAILLIGFYMFYLGF